MKVKTKNKIKYLFLLFLGIILCLGSGVAMIKIFDIIKYDSFLSNIYFILLESVSIFVFIIGMMMMFKNFIDLSDE